MRNYGTTNNTPAHQAPPVWRAPEGPEGTGGQHTDNEPRPIGGRREACGAWPRCRWGLAAVPVGPGRGAGGAWPRCRWGLAAVPVGGGRARAGLEIDHSEP